MKKLFIICAVLLITGTISLSFAFGQGQGTGGQGPGQSMGQGRGPGNGPGNGPPPEAFTACEGKSEGDSVEIQTPRGDTITGTCQDHDGQLALRPDNGPPDRQ